MRWEELFRDLEAQLEAEERAVLLAEVSDRIRQEWAQVRFTDRLRPLIGGQLTLHVLGAGPLAGTLTQVGPDWLLLTGAAGLAALVPAAAILAVRGLGRRTGVEVGVVAGRLRLGYALRGIARDRRAVVLVLTDGTSLPGTIDRVGADFVEVAEHPAGEPRRALEVRQVRGIPFSALAVVQAT